MDLQASVEAVEVAVEAVEAVEVAVEVAVAEVLDFGFIEFVGMVKRKSY